MADRGRARDGPARHGLRRIAAPGRERAQGHLQARGRRRDASRAPRRSPRARSMSIRVRNADTKAAPNVAVTVETDPSKPGQGTAAFGQRVDDSRLSDPERPIWVVDNGPSGGDSAATNTWALGPPQGRPDQGLPLEGHRRRARLLHDQVPHLPRPHRPRPARLRRPHRRLLQGRDRRQAGPGPRRRRRQRRPRRGARRLQGLARRRPAARERRRRPGRGRCGRNRRFVRFEPGFGGVDVMPAGAAVRVDATSAEGSRIDEMPVRLIVICRRTACRCTCPAP